MGSTAMDATFFEEHLNRDLYKPKKPLFVKKKPIRVLVTDAGGKIAYNIIYQLCRGNVFGRDQEIVIHLINSRGSNPHKSVFLELEQCGFSSYTDFVVSSNPEIAYYNVDVVIAIATYEEIPGRSISDSMVYQMIKARQVAVYVQQYANKDAKIIFAGPSTKAITILLGAFHKFAPKISHSNITAASMLDIVVSKSLLAKKLKTTTDKIKNVVIWASTFPDICNATVTMYPPGDRGNWKMKKVPIAEAIQDDMWLFKTFPMDIYGRLMSPDLLKYGKAVTQSVVLHLQYLFQGSDKFDEMPSMSVISPPGKLYGVPQNVGFSFPVRTAQGKWTIVEDVKYGMATHLNILRSVFNLTHSVMANSIMKVVSYMLDYEAVKQQVVDLHHRHFIEEVIETRNWINRYFVTPNPAEGVIKLRDRTRESKKSIAWDDEANAGRKKLAASKSAIRFSLETADKEVQVMTERRSRRGSAFSTKSDEMLCLIGSMKTKSLVKM